MKCKKCNQKITEEEIFSYSWSFGYKGIGIICVDCKKNEDIERKKEINRMLKMPKYMQYEWGRKRK